MFCFIGARKLPEETVPKLPGAGTIVLPDAHVMLKSAGD